MYFLGFITVLPREFLLNFGYLLKNAGIGKFTYISAILYERLFSTF